MAAKEVTTWVVEVHFTNPEAAGVLVDEHAAAQESYARESYVCPHCGKPWPEHDDGSLFTEDQYCRNVESQRFRVDSYCCAATGRDCSEAIGGKTNAD